MSGGHCVVSSEGMGVVPVPLPCCRPGGGVVARSSCRVSRHRREEANHEIAAHEEPPTKRYFPILGLHVGPHPAPRALIMQAIKSYSLINN